MGIDNTVRNLAVMGSIDDGKTTLTSWIEYLAGIRDSPGNIEAGSTTTDFDPVEKLRGITIHSAATWYDYRGIDWYLVDTPGHPDFFSEVQTVLNGVDNAVLLVDAVEGAKPTTQLMARMLIEGLIPFVTVFNKMDKPGSEERWQFSKYELEQKLGIEFAPVQQPVFNGSFSGVEELAERGEYPLLFASGLQGIGVEELMGFMNDNANPPHETTEGTSAVVLKTILGKGHLLRVYSGELERGRYMVGEGSARITYLGRIRGDQTTSVQCAGPGEIVFAKATGDLHIGDTIAAKGLDVEYKRPDIVAPRITTAVRYDRDSEARMQTAKERMMEANRSLNMRFLRGEWLLLDTVGELAAEVALSTMQSECGVEVLSHTNHIPYLAAPGGAYKDIQVELTTPKKNISAVFRASDEEHDLREAKHIATAGRVLDEEWEDIPHINALSQEVQAIIARGWFSRFPIEGIHIGVMELRVTYGDQPTDQEYRSLAAKAMRRLLYGIQDSRVVDSNGFLGLYEPCVAPAYEAILRELGSYGEPERPYQDAQEEVQHHQAMAMDTNLEHSDVPRLAADLVAQKCNHLMIGHRPHEWDYSQIPMSVARELSDLAVPVIGYQPLIPSAAINHNTESFPLKYAHAREVIRSEIEAGRASW